MNLFHRYLAQRLAASLVTLWGVSLIVFLMVRLLPGDPARMIAGLLASEEETTRIRVQLGLTQAIHVQYGIFMSRLVRGNLGVSARTSRPVASEVLERLPNTLRLVVASSVVATAVGMAAGVMSAARPYSLFDYGLSVVALFGISMPVYWLGLMLIIVFAIQLNWLPAAGADQPGSLVMPALTLGAFSMAIVARMTRSSLLEVLNQDYVRTARSKGVRETVVVIRHALRNALIPIITAAGLQFGTLLGGAVLTESVFGWPGMGQLLVDSIFSRDYPVVQGIVLTFSTLFIATNLVVDLLYAYVDPRIHYG